MASIIDCKKIQPLLSEYVDDALPSGGAWDIKLHLASCAVCARAAEELGATVSLLKEMPRQETSASFEAALARRLADQVLQPRRAPLSQRLRDWWTRPRVRSTIALAGALAALVPVAVVLRSQMTPVPGTGETARTTETVEQQFLNEVIEEHASFASAQPLGDRTAVILATSPGMSAKATEEAF